MRRLRPLTTIAVLAGLAAAACPPAPAVAAQDRGLRNDLGRIARGAGGHGGFAVLDGASGRTLAADGADAVHPLGSTAKLLTTGAALDRLGRGAALTTTVLVTVPADEAGVVAGDLVLRGGGDPTLGEAGLGALADAVQAAGVRVVAGSVVGDESAFDALRGGPAGGGAFDPDLQGVLGALTYDKGRQEPGGTLQTDPARAAAFRLDDLLEAHGIVVGGRPRAGVTPPGALALATASTPLRAVVKITNKTSDDFDAEILAKDVGVASGGGGTTAAGAAAIAAAARRLGAVLRPVDGSGVDRATRGSARQLARYVRRVRTRAALASSLPVAGVDGTLAGRMRTGPAHRRCRAKTGTLPDERVSALAGWCRVGGRTIVFALLREGVRGEAAAKATEDRMVQRIARG
ncbi:hypothetical protein FSW04_09685 [Baekduia soli]|uniref:D-alanyl-D-alanine carboxypeptidase/D-alanyl-D-alanine-endopeptidase n=1 Tax=Baekduia soli TaxID=496014 RepID=A0A5B8U4D1_9ACTN|nr:D-alanyl-D-alanine carboxypeptidase [Baekduia soli]QEC47811.1 hypothetical protein FSW04_09685 [Baekduia soli]